MIGREILGWVFMDFSVVPRQKITVARPLFHSTQCHGHGQCKMVHIQMDDKKGKLLPSLDKESIKLGN